MKFVGGGAGNYSEWLAFLGLVKDRRVPPAGSPFQINFPREVNPGFRPLNASLPGCGDPRFQCSCGDCSSAPGCSAEGTDDVGPERDELRELLGRRVSAGLWCALVALVCLAWGFNARFWWPLVAGELRRLRAGPEQQGPAPDWDSWWRDWAETLRPRDQQAGGGQGQAGQSEAPLLREDWLASDSGSDFFEEEEEEEGEEEGGVLLADGGQAAHRGIGIRHLSHLLATAGLRTAAAQGLRRWLRHRLRWLGSECARRPYQTLGTWLAVTLVLSAGVLRVGVETDPLRLWVRPGSRAAREKDSFERSFGRFFRVEQLVLSTRPGRPGDPAPPIVTDANIELMFEMQRRVDALAASVSVPKASDGASGALGRAHGPAPSCLSAFLSSKYGISSCCRRPGHGGVRPAGGPLLPTSGRGRVRDRERPAVLADAAGLLQVRLPTLLR